MEAARTLFLTKGYVHTTMLDIAEAAELSRRTIYLYFTSKEEITFQVIYDAFTAILESLRTIIEQHPEASGFELIKAMKGSYMDLYEHQFDQFYFTLFFDYKLSNESLSDADAKACMDVIGSIVDLFTGALEKGAADGSIVLTGEARSVAHTMMTIIHSTMQKVASRRDVIDGMFSFDGVELIEQMFDLLLNSLSPKTSPGT